jgi:ankyrin repeat protein
VDGKWEGLEIVQWLASQGVDLKARAANGDHLLHIATDAGDARLVRYLLDHGLDASTRGEFGLPALGSARSDEIALMLLEAGSDYGFMDDANGKFRAYAEQSNWPKVLDWLTKHGK